MKRVLISCFLGLFFSSIVFGGDVAQYINFGFSDDSKYFMFGQYGIDSAASAPYAEMYIVDVARNIFVPQGTMKARYPMDIQPGQEGQGALFSLFRSNISQIEKHKINHLEIGRVLYLLVNGTEPKSNLEFRDFYNNKTIKVALIQETFGTGKTVSSSFHLNLSIVDGSGSAKKYTVGLPDYRRQGVLKYRIKQILYAPDEKSLIFVIAKDEVDTDGVNVRYMVETISIQ